MNALNEMKIKGELNRHNIDSNLRKVFLQVADGYLRRGVETNPCTVAWGTPDDWSIRSCCKSAKLLLFIYFKAIH